MMPVPMTGLQLLCGGEGRRCIFCCESSGGEKSKPSFKYSTSQDVFPLPRREQDNYCLGEPIGCLANVIKVYYLAVPIDHNR